MGFNKEIWTEYLNKLVGRKGAEQKVDKAAEKTGGGHTEQTDSAAGTAKDSTDSDK